MSRKIDMSSARISLILFFRVMLLFFHIGFSLAAEVYAILQRISDFDPSSESGAPIYLKLATLSSSFPVTSIRSCMSFELLVVFSVFPSLSLKRFCLRVSLCWTVLIHLLL